MRFAAITDLHFGKASPYRGVDRKLTGHAPALTAAFVDEMNRRVRPDFVIVLGDVIEDDSPHPTRRHREGPGPSPLPGSGLTL